MFFVMYISSQESLEKLVSILKTYFQGESINLKDKDHELIISTAGFTLWVSSGGNKVKFASEDYATQFEFCLWFDIVTSCSDWADRLMKFSNSVLLELESDLVLESYGEKPMLLRKAGRLYVDRNLGDANYPFEHLEVEFEKTVLRRE